MPREASGRVRWAVNVRRWEPYGCSDRGFDHKGGGTDGPEMDFLLRMLPEDEATRVRRFRRLEDRKRALVSRLLQRACVGVCTGLSPSEADIRRTKGGKPFLAAAAAGGGDRRSPGAADLHMPNFNFNVSHEGDFVVLASEPVCIVGVDVAAPSQVRGGAGAAPGVAKLKQSFERTCSDREWEAIACCPSPEEQEAAFRRHWSCKEAFVKARGDGLGFELARAEFTIEPENSGGAVAFRTSLRVGGQPARRWAFHVEELGSGHWVTVARGPPSDVVDAHGNFRRSLRRIDDFGHLEWTRELCATHPAFSLLSISDLVPEGKLDAFEECGGDVL